MKKTVITLLATTALLMGCRQQKVESVSQEFNQLPPAVQNTVRAAAPNAEITSISRETQNGVEVYEIDLFHNGQRPQMVVGLDGKMIRSDLAAGAPGLIDKAATAIKGTGAEGTSFTALPVKVQDAIRDHAKNDEITGISRHEDDGLVTYEIRFRNAPQLRVSADGTVLAGKRD